MILLIDEKIKRQINYGWNENRFLKFQQKIDFRRVTSVEDLEKTRYEFLNKMIHPEIILLHISFYDNLNQKKTINEIIETAISKETILVQFSGSFQTRKIIGNIVTLSPQAFYGNLESALNQYINKNKISVLPKYFAFGDNYELEELLLAKSEIWEQLFDLCGEKQIDIENYIDNYKDNIDVIERLTNSKNIYSENISVSEFKYNINKNINEQ